MYQLEQWIIQLLLLIFTREEINAFFRDPQQTAIIVGSLIAVSGALLGVFLLLRGMSLTSDAISHTVLLGIVVAFMVMAALTGTEPDLSSIWLIVGAAAAGVATVVLTEMIYRSGLVKQDAALGLAFPLLFAIAIILISRFVDDVHLDEDAVLVGEIGVAWANTNSHCLDNCEAVTITPDDPRAEVVRQCVNCRNLGISPRDEGAKFEETCANCGSYSPGQAWQAGLVSQEPLLVFWPKSVTVLAVMALLTILFVVLFYKELKLSTFDAALAQALGFRPGLLNYALMILVSLVAVGAFDAVGSILVIAFFIIPPAAGYLLTDRLPVMLVISALIGAAGAYFGYDLARGSFLGVVQIDSILVGLNRAFGLGLLEEWDSSISASMVLMIFFFFLAAWVLSPKSGVISTAIRRRSRRRRFREQVVLGHIYHHEGSAVEAEELAASTLHDHFHWLPSEMQQVLQRLIAAELITVASDRITLTEQGRQSVQKFRQTQLTNETGDQIAAGMPA